MTQPITWKSLNSDIDTKGIALALAAAGKSIDSGFTGFQDLLKNEQAVRSANLNTQIDNSTQDFLNKLQGYNPDQLRQAMQDGTIDRMRSGYDVMLDPTKTGAGALQSLLTASQQQATQQRAYDDGQAEYASRGTQNTINSLLAAGKTKEADPYIAQLPEAIKAKFLAERDKVGDMQLGNKFYTELANGNIDGAADMLPELSKNVDTSAHQEALRQARTKATQNQLITTLGSVESEYQKRLKARNAEGDSFIRNELGLKPDMVGATAEQLTKYDQYMKGLAPLTRQTVQNEIFDPVLARYKDSNLYDPAFENQLKLQQASATADSGIHQIDLDQVQKEEQGLLGALANNGNIFAQEANNPATKESIHEMFSSVTKGNPAFENLDLKERQALAARFVQLGTVGPEIADSKGNIRNVPVPQTILKTMLEGGDGDTSWFDLRMDGDKLDVAVTDFMKKSGIINQWDEIEEVKGLSKRKLADLARASGKADADFLPGIETNARNARKIVKAKEEAEAAKARAKEEAEAQALEDKKNYAKHPVDPSSFGGPVSPEEADILEYKLRNGANAPLPLTEQELLAKKLKELVIKNSTR